MRKITLLSLFLSLTVFPYSLPAAALKGMGEGTQHIVVNNRVLAYVNGKAITVLDVMKRMDMLFLRQFPEYANSPQARYQFYQANWRQMLQELIDKELILEDAVENKVPMSAGDVRQEMEQMFGPNIIANLDKIGLTFDEAFKIVHGDLLLKRMMGIRVNGKVMRTLTPQMIRQAYEEFAANNIKKETWHYQVITIRNTDPTLGAETANSAFKLLSEEGTNIDDLNAKLKENGLINKSTVTISDPYFHTESDVNESIKENLAKLTSGTFSAPVAQRSRADKSTVFRIFYLKEQIPAGAIPYKEIENQLKEELFQKLASKESEQYIKRLREKYAVKTSDIDERISEDFQPFQFK